jgi:phosphatidate phosphatase APP1
MGRHAVVIGIACCLLGYGDLARSRQRPGAQQGTQKPDNPDKTAEKRVSGTVVDRDGKGLAGVKVTVKGEKTTAVWTDANGSFHFSARPGAYEITVKVGAKSHKFDATIDEQVGLDPAEFRVPNE